MKLSRFARALFFPALFLITFTASAELRLPKLWSDHAVIQRDRPIHVWGWADVGERVTATLRGSNGGAEETASATTDSLGHWSLYLAPRPAGGGAYTLTVSGSNTITVNDLLMGDVWLASGQSNMEMPLLGFPGSAVLKNGPEEIKAANHPEIRLLHEPKRFSYFPMQDQEATWEICTPETAASFSSVAYFFAREIQHDQKVPIGVVEADWGGTPAESWTSLDTLGNDAGLMPVFAARAAEMDKQADVEAIKARYAREDAAANGSGTRAGTASVAAAGGAVGGGLAVQRHDCAGDTAGDPRSDLVPGRGEHRPRACAAVSSALLIDDRRLAAAVCTGRLPFPVCADIELQSEP